MDIKNKRDKYLSEDIYIVGTGKGSKGNKYDILAQMLSDEEEMNEVKEKDKFISVNLEVGNKAKVDELEVVELEMVNLRSIDVDFGNVFQEELVTIVGEGIKDSSHSNLAEKIINAIKTVDTVKEYEQFVKWLEEIVEDNSFDYNTLAVFYTTAIYIHYKISKQIGLDLSNVYLYAKGNMKKVTNFDSYNQFVMPSVRMLKKEQVEFISKNDRSKIGIIENMNNCLIGFIKIVSKR